MITALCVSFIAAILLGIPIAFAMLTATAVAMLVEGSLPFALIAQRVGAGVENFTYLAIPLFILAGSIMEESGISTDWLGWPAPWWGIFGAGWDRS